MNSEEIRNRFLRFFEKRGHTIIPSASLVPENDPSVLFNTAGMQPLVPYLLGASHPSGSKRLANSQKCVRTVDIDEIGDNTHATFFEMLGNWSLGDYFKEDAIKWSYEFLTSKEEGLGLDSGRLYVTVFEGDENAPRDEEAFEIWKKYVPENRIYFMGAKSNWWSPGDNGPCGPDSEMFYDVTEKGLGDMTKEEYMAADDRQDIVEIWNDVFMEYEKKDGKVTGKLKQQNVDTGSGLERVAMVVQGKNNIFDMDLLLPIMSTIKSKSSHYDERSARIVADHIRTSVFMIADGVIPSNTDRGYVLRRLIRRAVRYSRELGISGGLLEIIETVIKKYADLHGFDKKRDVIISGINNEKEKFERALAEGLKKTEKMFTQKTPIEIQKFASLMAHKDKDNLFRVSFENRKKGKPFGILELQLSEDDVEKATISGTEAFDMYQSFGLPKETIIDLARDRKLIVDSEDFDNEMKKHQDISRVGSEQKFKGGLADTSEQSVKYHTATHLLHKALREVLGNHVFQKGSNITPERLRFDFSHGEKMTDEQKKRVEDMVNEKISEALPVTYEDLSLAEAEKKGAIGLFEEKYGDTVRVYKIGPSTKESSGQAFSLEFCGGPHVKNTSELGHFKVAKEEACSAGIRRIKAILE